MIIIKLIGGLGNQMFQYAMARSLAHSQGTNFKLDICDYDLYLEREYSLGNFNIIENFVDCKEIQRFRPRKIRSLAFIRNLITELYKRNNFQYIQEEKEFHYNSYIFQLNGNLYLEGYWQTHKYFENIESLIKQEFKVRPEPNIINRKILLKIAKVNAIALHVRRGDYVTDSHTNLYHGTCDLEYYNSCIDLIINKIDNPHFFVFSDDPVWVKENIKTNFPTTYISHNSVTHAYEDMRLMRRCDHFIISNSTFSWWGAWLSDNPSKIVIAPKRWLKKDINTRDLLPKTWKTV